MTHRQPTPADWRILKRFRLTFESAPTAATVNVRDCPGLTALPDLPAATHVEVWDCPGLGIFRDNRGYSLIHRKSDDRFFAGCRNFTRAKALAHWGGSAYSNKARGAAFCAAINAQQEG